MNSYERDARDRKAGRLAATFYERARLACFKIDEASARKPRGVDECADDILAMVVDAQPRHWIELGRMLRMNPPSATTMALARDKVIDRAKAARNRARRKETTS